MRIKPQAAGFALLGLIWGSEWLATRVLDLPPLQALAARYAMAALLLGTVLLVFRIPLPGRRQSLTAVLTGATMMALSAMLTVWATQRVSPGLLVVLLAMTPLVAALLEGRAMGTVLAPLVGGIAGTALIASQGLSFAPMQLAGGAAVLLAAILIAGSIITVKRSLAGVPVVATALLQFAAASTCVAVASLFVEGRDASGWTWRSAGLELVLAILANALAFPLYYWLLRRWESFQLTASQWLATVVGVAEGLLLVHEAPSWRIVAGALINLASLIVLWRSQPEDDLPETIYH